MTQKKSQAQEKGADKKANVAMTQHDSIFPDIKLPGGISTKATEYKNLAEKGEKWESPIFGIGSASETSNLPALAPVGRKPHSATQGAVRGAQNVQGGQSAFGQAEPRTYTSGSAGFSNQVNEAFAGNNDLSLKGNTGGVNGGIPESGVRGADAGHTTLGANNPVLSGSG